MKYYILKLVKNLEDERGKKLLIKKKLLNERLARNARNDLKTKFIFNYISQIVFYMII